VIKARFRTMDLTLFQTRNLEELSLLYKNLRIAERKIKHVVFDSNLNFAGHIEETKIIDYGNGRFIIAENAEGVQEVQEFT